MNNKNIIIGISLTLTIVAIAMLVLAIVLKGKEMKNWILENVFCCFGKKKNVEVQTENNNEAVNTQSQKMTQEEYERKIKKINDEARIRDEEYKKEKAERERERELRDEEREREYQRELKEIDELYDKRTAKRLKRTDEKYERIKKIGPRYFEENMEFSDSDSLDSGCSERSKD